MKAYLGAPLFTPYHREVLDKLTEVMNAAGFEVFSPLEESKPIWNGRAPNQCSPEERRQVVAMNYRGIRESDIVFAWIGGWNPAQAILDWAEEGLEILDTHGGMSFSDAVKRFSPSLPDTGVAVEIGYAFGIGKPILGYLHDDESERNFNLMLSDGTMNGIARGLDQLKQQLENYKSVQMFIDTDILESEPEEMPA